MLHERLIWVINESYDLNLINIHNQQNKLDLQTSLVNNKYLMNMIFATKVKKNNPEKIFFNNKRNKKITLNIIFVI